MSFHVAVRGRGDHGFGLPELLVSMVVFGIVASAVTAVFVNTVDSVRFVAAKTSTTADARIAMEAMTRSIRMAITPKGETAAIISAEPGRIEFYASVLRAAGQTRFRPTKVTYQHNVTTGCLEETQVAATDRSPADPSRPFVWTASGTTKCLIQTNAAPTFQYFDDGRILQDTGTPVIPVTLPGGGLQSSDGGEAPVVASVISIQVSLNVQSAAAVDVNGTLAVDRVTLSNVQYAMKIEG